VLNYTQKSKKKIVAKITQASYVVCLHRKWCTDSLLPASSIFS